MAKNMTRKGLAVSAALALGLSGFTALPASAAPGVIFQPASGSTSAFGVLGNQTFDLTVGITAGVASSNLAVLKYKIEKADGFVVNWAAAARDGSYAGLTPGATEAGSDLAYTAQVASSTTSAVVSPNTPSTSVANGIKLNVDGAAATDATRTVTVTAFLDTVNDGVYDSVNEAGQSVTISFIDSDDVTWTTDFTTPALGDTTMKATVTASPANLNLFQVDAQSAIAVGFGTRGASADTAVAGTGTTITASSRDYTAGAAAADADADNDLDVSATPSSGLTAATYVAQALRGSTEIGSEVIKAVAAATVGEIGEATTTAGANFQVTDNSGAADAVDVRSTVTSVPVTLIVKDTATPKVVLANTSVKVTITEKHATNNTDAATFSAGGQTLKDTTSSADKIEFTLVSNAAGEITFNVVSSGAKAGDGFTVSGSAQGVSSAYATIYTWETAVATALANVDVNGTGAVLKNAVGSTTTLNYAVVDQFGVLAQNTDLRIKATDGTTVKYGTVSNGRASVQYGPYDTAATKTMVVELQAKDTDENYYDLDEAGKLADYSSAITATNVSLVIGSSNSASALTLVSDAGSSVLALNTNDQSSADTRLGETAPTVISSGTIATLSGAVSDVTTAGTYSTVTLSAAGVLFKAGSKFSTGSITVQTSATGAYDGVEIYSNKSGKVTVTATAGSATKTLEVEFAAAKEETGTVLTIDAPANVMPGSTWTASAKLVDKYGNVVDTDQGVGGTTPTFSFSAVSPGIQVGSNPTATDADGLAKLAYFIGSNDSGTIVLTATYDADGNTATTTDKYTVSKNIVIGAAVAAQSTSVKRTGNTVAVRVTGYAKSRIVLNGTRVASRSSLGTLTRTVNLRAGRNVIQIVVDGKVIRTVRYTR